MTALCPEFIDGFASECARMGLSEDMTDFFYKQAVFKAQTQVGKFAEGFMEEFEKSAGGYDKLLNMVLLQNNGYQ